MQNVQIYIEGRLLELDEAVIINQILQSSEIYDPAKLRADFTRTISIPNTGNNNALFGAVFSVNRNIGSGSPNSGKTFNQYKRANFKMFVNDRLFTDGYCKLENINFQTSNIFRYEITLFGSIGIFFRDLGQTMLSELLSESCPYVSKIRLSAESILNLWNARKDEDNNRGELEYMEIYSNGNLTTQRTDIKNATGIRNLYFDLIDAENGLYNSGTAIQFARDNNDNNDINESKYNYPVTEQQLQIKTAHKQRLGFFVDMLLFIIAKRSGYTINKTQFTSVKNPYFSRLMVTGKILSEHAQPPVNVVASGDASVQISTRELDLFESQILPNPGTITAGDYITLYDDTTNNVVKFEDNELRPYTEHVLRFDVFSETTCFVIAAGADAFDGDEGASPFNSEYPSLANEVPFYEITFGYKRRVIGSASEIVNINTIYLVWYISLWPENKQGLLYFEHRYQRADETSPFAIEIKVEDNWILLDTYIFERIKTAMVYTVDEDDRADVLVTPVIIVKQALKSNLKYIWNASGGGFDSLATNYNGLDPSIFDLDFQSPEYTITINEQRKINSLSEVFLHNLLPDVKAADFFLSYCKLFGLYPVIDNTAKTISLLNRNEYYIDNVIDAEDKFCINLEHTLEALNFDSKFLNLAYKDGQTFEAKNVRAITGIENGSIRLNTGNEFNTDVYNFFKDTCFESVVCKTKNYDEYGFIREPNIIPYLHQDELSKGKIYNPVALLFANGYKDSEVFEPRLGNRYYFAFVDDTPEALAKNSDIYNLSNFIPVVVDGRLQLISNPAIPTGVEPPDARQLETITLYPSITEPTFSVDFNAPVLQYFPDEYPTGITIFERYWKNYLLDRYDQNTKVFTGYFWLPDYILSRDLLREFLFFRNQYWSINKVVIRDVTKNEPAKLELVSVQDITNYTTGIVPGFTDLGYIIRFMVSFRGNVVEGAIISVDGKTGVTNAMGYVDILLEEGSYVYTVTADGYNEKSDTVVVDMDKTVNVLLSIGKYTDAELLDLINNQGYIPVASGAELDSLRNTGSRTMGAGTEFQGTYTTGKDKKYVQVDHVSLSAYQAGSGWDPIGFSGAGNTFTGVFDGNELNITDLLCNNPGTIFQSLLGIGTGKAVNTRIVNCNITGGACTGGIYGYFSRADANSTIDNCQVSGTINGDNYVGGICGVNFDISGGVTSGGVITNCKSTAVITATEGYNGGIVGYSRGANAYISYCEFTGTLENTATSAIIRGVGGIVGELYHDVYRCKVDADITGRRVTSIGGIAGRTYGNPTTIEECEAKGQIIGNLGVAGIQGAVEQNSSVIKNCKSEMSVIVDCQYQATIANTWRGAGLYGGGSTAVSIINSFTVASVSSVNYMAGTLVLRAMSVVTPTTVTNSYWSTEASGQASGLGGIDKTIAQLKAGAIGAADIFTGWSTDIWDAGDNDTYPFLKALV